MKRSNFVMQVSNSSQPCISSRTLKNQEAVMERDSVLRWTRWRGGCWKTCRTNEVLPGTPTKCSNKSNHWKTLPPRGLIWLCITCISVQTEFKSSFSHFTFSTTYNSPEGTSAHGYRFASGILGAFTGKTSIFFKWFYSFYSHLGSGISRK